MQTAPVSMLKARLSQYLAAVKSGEEVIVTEHGRPIARLTGMGRAGAVEGRTSMLIREGLLRPPVGKRSDTAPPTSPMDPSGRSLELLLDERAQDR